MRGATFQRQGQNVLPCISIHAPHAGRDLPPFFRFFLTHTFQSTRPMRGATAAQHDVDSHQEFQSTRPMRGATCRREFWMQEVEYFNPRAPCGARRLHWDLRADRRCYFNPRAPCGARPHRGVLRLHGHAISIHAPHAGRDLLPFRACECRSDFNPRAPCGARQTGERFAPQRLNFNPRAPCGARRIDRRLSRRSWRISIHAPHAGRDRTAPTTFRTIPIDFNPRAPCGARRWTCAIIRH